MMKRALATVLAMVAVADICYADGIELQFDGSAKEAAELLSEKVGMPLIGLDGEELGRKVVHLDLRGTGVHEAVVALCREAGAVYRYRDTDMYPYMLTPGDISVDARPKVEASEYIVTLEAVTLTESRTIRFANDRPETLPETSLEVTAELSIEPKTLEALRRFDGLSTSATATSDSGLRLKSGGSAQVFDYQLHQRKLRLAGVSTERRPQRLADLTGVLVTWGAAEIATVEFDLAESRQTLDVGGTPITLEDYVSVEGGIEIYLRPEDGRISSRDFTVRLLGPDGQEKRLFFGGLQGDTLHFRFVTPGWEPMGLRVTRYVKSEPNTLLEFTIKDIPLP